MTSFGRFFLRIMSRVKKRTSNVCSKQRANTKMACKSLDLNTIDDMSI